MPRLTPREDEVSETSEVPTEQPQVQIITESQYFQQAIITIVENQEKILELLSSKKEQ